MVAIQVSREGLLGKWLGAPCLFCLLTSESLNHIWIFVLLSNLTFIFCSVEKWNQYNVCVCVCVNKTYMYFKELARVIVKSWEVQDPTEAGRQQMPGRVAAESGGCLLGSQEEPSCLGNPKAFCWKLPLVQIGQIFVLFHPLTDWMWPTHIWKSSLLYSKSTDFCFHPKAPSQTYTE